MNLDTALVILLGLLGLMVGSFTNVLIWRLPRGENIAFPPSHCPHCDHALAPRDLVPLFSWLSLRGQCRYCQAPIKARYPVVELISGVGYGLIAALFPLSSSGLAPLGLMLLFTILLAGSAIDLDTYTLPDALTLPGVLLGLLFGWLNERMDVPGLPHFAAAVQGALLGAGLLVSIDLLGSWVLRRFRERRYPDHPIGYQQIALGLLVGAWLGPWWALGAGLASTLLNFLARKVIPVPDVLTLGGLLATVILKSSAGPALLGILHNAVAGAGAVALLAGFYWWWQHTRSPAQDDEDAPFDPSAMGFGDVKLAAAIGAFLGWEKLLITVGVAVLAGTVFGLVQMVLRSENKVKFGPYLALGAVVALFWGTPVLEAYRRLIGG